MAFNWGSDFLAYHSFTHGQIILCCYKGQIYVKKGCMMWLDWSSWSLESLCQALFIMMPFWNQIYSWNFCKYSLFHFFFTHIGFSLDWQVLLIPCQSGFYQTWLIHLSVMSLSLNDAEVPRNLWLVNDSWSANNGCIDFVIVLLDLTHEWSAYGPNLKNNWNFSLSHDKNFVVVLAINIRQHQSEMGEGGGVREYYSQRMKSSLLPLAEQ